MKTPMKLFFALLFVAGLSLAAYVVLAQSSGTPSFEVEPLPYGPDINSFSTTPNPVTEGATSIRFTVAAADISGVNSAAVQIVDSGGSVVGTVALYDDGQHNDGVASDGVLANTWNLPDLADGAYNVNVQAIDALGNVTPEAGGYEYRDTLVIGSGFCLDDSDCTEAGFPQCCSGTCREADLCLSDSDCGDTDACTIDSCDLDSCPNVCSNIAIIICDMVYADGCCPSGCDSSSDVDCTGDVTSPLVNITDPTDGASLTVDTYTVVVSASDPESGIERVEFKLSGNLMGTQYFDSPAGSGVYSWIWDVSSVSNGSYMLAAVVYNNEGLGAEDVIGIDINRPASVAPFNVNITSPATGSTFSSGTNFDVVVHAEDDVDIASVSVFSVINGYINEGSASGASDTSVDVTIGVNSNSLAYLEEAITSYAGESSGFRLPFVPVAWADTNTNCTTTTNTYWDDIYAVAYDNEDLSTQSAQISVGRTVTSTVCGGGGGDL